MFEIHAISVIKQKKKKKETRDVLKYLQNIMYQILS